MLAVAMLNGFTAKTEARRISLSVSRPSLVSAQLADVVAAFYRARPAGGAGGGVGAITEGMIGMPEGSPPVRRQPVLARRCSRRKRLTERRSTPARSPASSTPPRAPCSSATCCSPSTTATPRSSCRSGDRRRRGCSSCIDRVRRSRRSASSSSWPRDRFRRVRPTRRSRADVAAARRSCSPNGRRRSSPSDRKSATRCRIRREHREGFRVGARRIRSSTRIARSSRCPTTRRRRRWPRCSTPSIPMRATSSCPTRARSACSTTAARGSRRRPTGSIATLIVDPAQKNGSSRVSPPWCRPRRRRGQAAGGVERYDGQLHAVAVASRRAALIVAVNVKSSGSKRPRLRRRGRLAAPRQAPARDGRAGRQTTTGVAAADRQPRSPPRRSCSTTPAASATTRPISPAAST